MKKVLTTIVAGALVLAFAAGCSNEPGPDKIIAKVTADVPNPEFFNVTYGQYKNELNFALANYGLSLETTDIKEKEQITQIKQDIIRGITQTKMVLRVSEDMGITLNDEQLKTAEETTKANLDAWRDFFEEEAKKEKPDASEEEVKADGEKMFQQRLTETGITEETFARWSKESVIKQVVAETALKDVTADQADIDKEAENAKNTYEKDSMLYENSELYSNLYAPEGSRMIKHILISFESEDKQKILELRQENKGEEADKLRAEKAVALLEKAKESEAKAKAGENFDTLIKEYSGDSGYKTYPDGYIVIENGKKFVQEFTKAAFSLNKIGDISEPVLSDHGYHILLFADNGKVTESGIEKAKEFIISGKQQEKGKELNEGWNKKYPYFIDYKALDLADPTAPAETTASK